MTDRPFVIEIAGLPEPADRSELLELILAAASLEVPLTVLLVADAAALLSSSSSRAWRQLIEHDLARVELVSPPKGAVVPAGVGVLSPLQRAELVRESTVIRA